VSCAIARLDATGAEALAATSDGVARMAHDVEFVVGEGPALEVASTGRRSRRWPSGWYAATTASDPTPRVHSRL
jgi:hypothetical protein